MSTATSLETTAADTTTRAPKIAHAWCTCYERDGITPFPSLCGQAKKKQTPPGTVWPADMQNCAVCDQMARFHVPCPRCGAAE